MLSSKNIAILSAAALLSTTTEKLANDAHLGKQVKETLVATSNSTILKQFPKGLGSVINIAHLQERNFSRTGHYFADESTADAAVLKVMSAFYADVTKQRFNDGTDDPRAPLEAIQDSLFNGGAYLDYSTISKNGQLFVSINLFSVGNEHELAESELALKDVNPHGKYSIKYREINGAILGETEATSRLGTFTRDATGNKFTVLINEKACLAQAQATLEDINLVRSKVILEQLKLIREEISPSTK